MFQTIREQIDTIFHEDPAAKSVLEIVLCYPGFHAILLHRFAHQLYGMGIPLIPRVISQISRFLQESKSIRARRSGDDFSSIMGWAL